MTLSAGTRLGPYEVESALGVGGMGEVYRARDVRLKRSVALKVLPERFARDADRLARFQREGELLATLNHPNIASVYGLETSGDVTAIVLELVEGTTLADMIARGPLPVGDVLAIGRQIADALEGAHGRGVVHRDLKPSNIKIAADGKVKVLDFGLAKMLTSDELAPSSSMSPTLSVQPKSGGLILGTAAYMSPEQARAKSVDARSDVWAFGCVVYEMLTGRTAFRGETVTDVLAAVITTEPDWKALPVSTPPGIRRLLSRCLQKDASRRFHHMADVRIEIEDALAPPSRAINAPIRERRTWWIQWGGWIAAGAMTLIAIAATLLGVAALIGSSAREGAEQRVVTRLELNLPDAVEPTWGAANVLALSPDGRHLAFVGMENGMRRAYLRNLAEREAHIVEGSEGATGCFFSPDGRSLGIVTNASLVKKVSLSDGLSSTIANSSSMLLGASWVSDDRIVHVRDGTLWTATLEGGESKQLTTLDAARREIAHMSPMPLGNGRAVVFGIRRDGNANDVGVVDLVSGTRRVIIERAASPMYAETGHLLFVQDGWLVGAAFDESRLTITGTPVRLQRIAGGDQATFAISPSGSLVYSTTAADQYGLVWVSRDGVERPLNDMPRAYARSRISRDGRYLATQIGTEIWMQDLARATFERVSGTEIVGYPVWTPDGSRLLFSTTAGVQWIAVKGDGSGTIAGTSGELDFPTSVSPDGRTLLLMRYGARSGDVYMVPMDGRAAAKPIVQTPAYDGGGQVSSDGRWIAYVSEESGRPQVYIRRFSGPEAKWPVSTAGGTQPVWSGNAKELFYRDGDKLMAVRVTGGAEPMLSQPEIVFQRRYVFGTHISIANYDVTPNGQQFAMIKDAPGSNQLKIVLNWFEELKAKVPTD